MALTWIKQGDESAAMAKQAEAETVKRKQEQGKMFRFWLKEGEDVRMTFVDGALNHEGFLTPPRFYEHQMYLNGSWNNQFVCPEKTNPGSGDKCPLCEAGDRPAMVALFTVIDHREFKGKTDIVYRDTPKLLVAKSQTFELLNKIAMKRGGLAGCTFDVSRMGDKAASVGSMFDFVEKHDLDDLKKNLVRTYKDDKGVEKTVSVFVAADYEKEIIYRDAAELRAMGLGKPTTPSAAGGNAGNTPAGSGNYADQL
jgi:hypothetical protein